MKDSIWLTTSKGKHERIKIPDVYWLEINSDSLILKLASKETPVKIEGRLKKVYFNSFLDFPEMFKVHSSYLINLDYADLIEDNFIYVKGMAFPIDKKVKRILEEKLNLVVY